jgi:predicted MPP superfamily phosphohydrolase
MRVTMKKCILGLLISLSLLNIAAVDVSRGPYLQQVTPNSIIIKWRTDTATESRVTYGTTDLSSATVSGTITTEHEVQLESLIPGTQYKYSIGNTFENVVDNEFTFRTAPIDNSEINIWIIGDSGTAGSRATSVRDAYKAFLPVAETDLWLMLGDNAYQDGEDWEYQEAVFEMYPSILKQVPLYSVLGNHDGHTADSSSESGPYYDIFSLPRFGEAGGVASGTEAYYSFDFGDIHFIALDSYDSSLSKSSSMYQWMESDLASTDKKWIIAFWHHPPYSKGSHDSDSSGTQTAMRENFVPLLESYKVDLVFSGHSHAYERSKFVTGHYGKSSTLTSSMIVDDGAGPYIKNDATNGAVYVVAGSSGQVSSSGSLNHPVMYKSLRELGSVVLNIDNDVLTASFIEDDGNVTDTFTITKGNVPDPDPDPDPDPPVDPPVDPELGTFDPDRRLFNECQSAVCHPGPGDDVYWVSNSGSDSNGGGVKHPLKNINTAINKIPANSGGTVCVNDGIYNEDVTFPISGTVEKLILLDAVGSTRGAVLTSEVKIKDVSNVGVRGFRIENSTWGIRVDGPNDPEAPPIGNIFLINNNTYDTFSSGISVWGSEHGEPSGTFNNINGVLIEGNKVELANNGGWNEMITVAKGVNNVHIRGNELTNGGNPINGGEGIDIKDGVRNAWIYDNYIHGISRRPIYVDGGRAYGALTGNINIFDNVTDGNPGEGIFVMSEGYGNVDGVFIYNNLVQGTDKAGIGVYEHPRGAEYRQICINGNLPECAQIKNVEITNNTIIDANLGNYWDSIHINHPDVNGVIDLNLSISPGNGRHIGVKGGTSSMVVKDNFCDSSDSDCSQVGDPSTAVGYGVQ